MLTISVSCSLPGGPEPALAQATAQNLISNPVFNNTMSGWHIYFGNSSVIPDPTQTGNYILRVTGNNTASVWQDISAAVVPGNTYLLTGQGRVSKRSTGGSVTVQMQNANGRPEGNLTVNITSTSFTTFELQFKVPPTVTTARLSLAKLNGTGNYVDFDNLSLTQTSAQTGAPGLLDGVCGSANGAALTAAPTSQLCSAGSASTVTGSGPWSWSCVGALGGTTAACTATKLPAGVTLKTYQAVPAAAFVDSIGVNGAANATTAAELQYLGIGHVRVGPCCGASLPAAGANGARLDVIFPWMMGTITSGELATFTSELNQASSMIEAVEGPNEVNTDPDIYSGLKGPAAFEALQKYLYALVKGDPNLNNASKTTVVYDFSVLQGTAAGTYSGMQNYADYNNVHAYGSPGIPPSWILPYETTHNTIAGSNPVVVTETGAETMPNSGVDQAMQARFDIEALLDDYKLDVPLTYIYNLQDWNTGSNSSNFSSYYGLYNTDGSIKLSGAAIHNMIALLSQTSGNTLSTPGSLSYSLTGLPYYGSSELFEKSDGAFDLALWNETTEWNATTHTEIAIPTNQIKITLGQSFATIAVYDPLVSAAPIQTISNTSSITVALNTDPLFIEFTPSSLSGSPAQ